MPKIIDGFAIGVEPMMRKSISPPPSRIAAPAAARSSYSFTPGRRARDHRVHGVLAQHAGLAHAVELLGAVDRQQLVQKALGEDELRVGQILAQHVVLVHRHVIAVARIDLHKPDAAALEFQFADASDHDIRIAPAAAVAHVLDGDSTCRRTASAWVPPIE